MPNPIQTRSGPKKERNYVSKKESRNVYLKSKKYNTISIPISNVKRNATKQQISIYNQSVLRIYNIFKKIYAMQRLIVNCNVQKNNSIKRNLNKEIKFE